MERYQCNFDNETRSKAVAQLHEPQSDEERLAVIDSFRNRFKSENPGISLENEDDLFILQFLRADKFVVSSALATMKNYHTRIPEHPEMFQKVQTPNVLQQLFDSGIICPLEGKAKDGSTVLITRVGLCKCPLSDLLSLFFVTAKNLLLEDEVNQVHGFTFIHDTKLLTLSVAKQFHNKVSRQMFQIVHKSLPIRVKAVNVTNESKIFDVLYGILLSFVDHKMKTPVYRHGKNFSKLYNFIDKTVLPKFVGGTGPDPKPILWKTKILK